MIPDMNCAGPGGRDRTGPRAQPRSSTTCASKPAPARAPSRRDGHHPVRHLPARRRRRAEPAAGLEQIDAVTFLVAVVLHCHASPGGFAKAVPTTARTAPKAPPGGLPLDHPHIERVRRCVEPAICGADGRALWMKAIASACSCIDVPGERWAASTNWAACRRSRRRWCRRSGGGVDLLVGVAVTATSEAEARRLRASRRAPGRSRR